jgi:hypothetical protein
MRNAEYGMKQREDEKLKAESSGLKAKEVDSEFYLRNIFRSTARCPAAVRMIWTICFNRLTVRHYDIILSG